MKQLNIICFVFISMAGLVSCGQNKEETFGKAEHIIALTPSADTLKVSGTFAKSELISLTGCSVVKVSEAVQVPSGIAVKGKFYTLSGDSKTESEVALFSREGEFITHVARKG